MSTEAATGSGIPARMRVVEITAPGGPEVLRPGERSVPPLAQGEVLIRVAAAGVNRPDCLQRRGLYAPPPGTSDIPGLEVAGVVVAHADDVTDLAVGSRVCALLAGGGYAEFAAVPAVQCLPKPDNLSWAQAAAIPETFFTVWSNVFERAHLRPGETLLVHGGASGIGTTAIQLACAFGARVFATVGNAEKRELCERLGAERAINYREEKFPEVVHELTAGRGADVILDIVGGDYLDANLAALAVEGRLAVIGVLGSARGNLNLAQLLTKRLTITASTLRPRSVQEKGRIAQALRHRVWPWLAAGAVAPVIQATLPLASAARAHEQLEANEAMGKLVLVVDESL
jgi:NADPH:quinone reductase